MAVISAAAPDEDEPADEEGDGGMTPYLSRLALVAGTGGLLFGFDTGIIGGILVVIGTSLSSPCPESQPDCTPRPLTAGEEELIVSATTVGALVGSLVAGWLSDRWGRKKTITLAALLFALGAFEQAAASLLSMLILGRLLVGLAVGLSSTVTPPYLAELSPPRFRGRLVALIIVLVTGGQLLAYLVGAGLYDVKDGWRWMAVIAALPAIVQLPLSLSLPESPRHLVAKGNLVAARQVLHKLYPNASAEGVERRVDRIGRAVRKEEAANARLSALAGEWGEGKRAGMAEVAKALWRNRTSRRALGVACGLQLFQQATGFNTLMYYSPRILATAGFPRPSLAATYIAASNFLSTIVALRLIDHVGRRTLLLRSLAGMVVGLFLVGATFLGVSGKGKGEDGEGPGGWAWGCVASMVVFCFAFGLGLGNVPWVVQSEVFTYEVRSIGNGLATATNWTANLLVSATFLDLTQAISPTGVFWMYALVSVGAYYFTYTSVPETLGVDLEDTQRLFEAEGSVWAAQRALQARASEEDRRTEGSFRRVASGVGGYQPVSSGGEDV